MLKYEEKGEKQGMKKKLIMLCVVSALMTVSLTGCKKNDAGDVTAVSGSAESSEIVEETGSLSDDAGYADVQPCSSVVVAERESSTEEAAESEGSTEEDMSDFIDGDSLNSDINDYLIDFLQDEGYDTRWYTGRDFMSTQVNGKLEYNEVSTPTYMTLEIADGNNNNWVDGCRYGERYVRLDSANVKGMIQYVSSNGIGSNEFFYFGLVRDDVFGERRITESCRFVPYICLTRGDRDIIAVYKFYIFDGYEWIECDTDIKRMYGSNMFITHNKLLHNYFSKFLPHGYIQTYSSDNELCWYLRIEDGDLTKYLYQNWGGDIQYAKVDTYDIIENGQVTDSLDLFDTLNNIVPVEDAIEEALDVAEYIDSGELDLSNRGSVYEAIKQQLRNNGFSYSDSDVYNLDVVDSHSYNFTAKVFEESDTDCIYFVNTGFLDRDAEIWHPEECIKLQLCVTGDTCTIYVGKNDNGYTYIVSCSNGDDVLIRNPKVVYRFEPFFDAFTKQSFDTNYILESPVKFNGTISFDAIQFNNWEDRVKYTLTDEEGEKVRIAAKYVLIVQRYKGHVEYNEVTQVDKSKEWIGYLYIDESRAFYMQDRDRNGSNSNIYGKAIDFINHPEYVDADGNIINSMYSDIQEGE